MRNFTDIDLFVRIIIKIKKKNKFLSSEIFLEELMAEKFQANS